MANVRITGSTKANIHKMQWLGAPAIDPSGHLERSLDLPEMVYQRIEDGIAKGNVEGILFLDDGRRLDWFLDRGAPASGRSKSVRPFGHGEGI